MDYREELTLSLASARELAAASIRKGQQKYKEAYNKRTTAFHVGDWILEEMGKARKLSRPWHGPYRATDVCDPICMYNKSVLSSG